MGSRLYSKRWQADSGRERNARPKSFKSEDVAKTWAEKNNIKDYKLVNLKSEDSKKKKIKIIF